MYAIKLSSILARPWLAAALCLGAGQAAADPVRALVVAAQIDNPVAVRQLLAQGLSPNTVDPVSGETVLIVATREGAQQVIEVLLGHPDIALEHSSPNTNTALMMAAFKRNKAAVLAMLAKGALVNRPGWTALHYAAASGDADIARILLEHGAAVNAGSPSQLTPLMIAAREGQEDVVAFLLQHGANPCLKNNEALTASQIAMRADKPWIARAIDAHLASKP